MLDMTIERALQILDSAKPLWSWVGVRNKNTEDMFSALSVFVAEHGDCRVPTKYRTALGLPLGDWLNACRMRGRAGRLAPETLRRLQAFDGFELSPMVAERDSKIARIKAYQTAHGTLPDAKYVDETGYRLGKWIHFVRGNKNAGRLTEDTIAAIETIPGWTWHNTRVAELISSIASKMKTKPSAWFESLTYEEMMYRRNLIQRHKNKESATPEQKKLLSSPGFVEHKRIPEYQHKWDRNFNEAFKRYSTAEYFPDMSDSPVARWLYHQRWRARSGEVVNPERIAKLEALPFWNMPHSCRRRGSRNKKWLKTYEKLKKRVIGRRGLPIRATDALYRFCWVHTKARKLNSAALDKTTSELLEAIPGWSWDGKHAFMARPKGT